MQAVNILDSQNSPVQKEDISIPYFKIDYRATVIKATCYHHKNIPVDKWNKIKHPKMNTQSYSHPVFDKDFENKKKRTGEYTVSFPSILIYYWEN